MSERYKPRVSSLIYTKLQTFRTRRTSAYCSNPSNSRHLHTTACIITNNYRRYYLKSLTFKCIVRSFFFSFFFCLPGKTISVCVRVTEVYQKNLHQKHVLKYLCLNYSHTSSLVSSFLLCARTDEYVFL